MDHLYTTSHLLSIILLMAESYVVKTNHTAVHNPGFQKFCAKRLARCEYIPPEKVTAIFDKKKVVERKIM